MAHVPDTQSRPAAPGRAAGIAAAAILLVALVPAVHALTLADAGGPPQTLRETGLYSDFEALRIEPRHLAFSPQYPLWTDGAAKRRWLSLPPGTAIDGSDPDAWVFPIGTRFWKEFSFGGKRVETRYLQRQPDGRWMYAAYEWDANGREARLTPEQGKRGVYPFGGRRAHAIPSVNDCKACHQGGSSEVLGFSALQLAPERDPHAPHAEVRAAGDLDLELLIEKGLLVGFPQSARARSRTAASPTERAALGYLHGNCGHCHNERGPLKNLGLFLRYATGSAVQPALTSAIRRAVKNPAPGQSPDALLRIEPQHPERSALLQRMASRYPPLQMPPLGTELADKQAVELLTHWIAELDQARGKTQTEEQKK